MQSSSFVRSSWLRNWFAFLCLLAVSIVSGVQVAHWDAQQSAHHALEKSVQTQDGLCPICYSVPVGHGAAPAAIVLVHSHITLSLAPVTAESRGIQPEFHLHTRPPPSLA